MSSVSTAFKVHYNQKLGDPFGHMGGTHHGLWGDRRPWVCYLAYCSITFGMTFIGNLNI